MAAPYQGPDASVITARRSRSRDNTEVIIKRSPDFEQPINRSTKGYCTNCGSEVGEFFNSWHRVTGSYYMPALLGSHRSLLKTSGKQKAAASGTDLEGCSIIPSSCPSTHCTDPRIGFTVVDAPASKDHFIDRDFFKLNRIELRCEIAPGKIVTVDPREEPATGTVNVNGSIHSSPAIDRTSVIPEEVMEVDTRPLITTSQMSHHPYSYPARHHDHSYQQHVRRQSEESRQPLSPPSDLRSPTNLASVSTVLNPGPNILALPPVQTIQQGPYARASPSVAAAATSLHFAPPRAVRATGQQSPSAHAYPRPSSEVSLDAVERLQTQISQNSGALAAQTRDIRHGEEAIRQLEASLRREFAAQVQRQVLDIQKIDEAVGRMRIDMHGMHQAMETLARDLSIVGAERQRAPALPSRQTISGQDSALELMAQQIAVMAHKTNEIDTLKITIEIMKNKVQRLEEGTLAQQTPAQATSNPPRQLQEPASASAQTAHQHASQPSPMLVDPVQSTPVQPPASLRTQLSRETSSTTTTPELAHRPEPYRGPSGFTAINTGIKRPNPSGSEGATGLGDDVAGSPKKQKTGGIDSVPPLPSQPHVLTDPLAPMTPDHRIPSSMPIQQSFPGVIPASQQPAYDPHGLHTDNWRTSPHRTTEHRSRGRPRGSGVGGRGGRVRKSLPVSLYQPGTPAWEDHQHEEMTMSQVSSDDYYNLAARTPRGIARRGSGGGGGRGGYVHSDRAVSLGLQGVSAGIVSPMGNVNDPYSHTKKTRSKPIRNADGVLIRKDGRPDMRSQSSAANLRKVHARKEEEAAGLSPSASTTPTNLRHSISIDVADTPSPPVLMQQDGQEITASVEKKHKSIMGKMFPEGLDESRRQHDYAHQVFEDDHDHTAQPRARRHSTSRVQHPVKAITKKDYETSQAEGPTSAERERVIEETQEEVLPQAQMETASG